MRNSAVQMQTLLPEKGQRHKKDFGSIYPENFPIVYKTTNFTPSTAKQY